MWKRTKWGVWYLGAFSITREDDENGSFWMCRLNGEAFDRADTLVEAKSYCHH